MQNFSIAELAHEEFECAAVKNKYIADSQSQYVGFCRTVRQGAGRAYMEATRIGTLCYAGKN